MLSKPCAGWTKVTIGDFEGRASYMTDVPMDCLIAFINALEYNIPASILFNEEGSEFTLVTSVDGTYIISEREEPKLFVINKGFLKLVRELINDIEDNLEDWVLWDYDYEFHNDSEGILNERRNIIKKRIKRLKELLKI